MIETRSALKELQRLDQDIIRQRKAIDAFEPQLEEVEGPALQLESEVTALRARLQEIRVEQRRLELSVDSKRDRMKKLDERLNAVRNVREEAAVHAEQDMVRRALEGDEQEALSLLDQIRRFEERLAEQEDVLQAEQEAVEPRRNALVDQRAAAEKSLEGLQAERDSFAGQIPASERNLYERIMAGGREVAVADLTEDGACGNCFSVIPLQLQQEVRHSNAMIRCEGCGVILAPPSPAPESPPTEVPPEAPAPEAGVVEFDEAAETEDVIGPGEVVAMDASEGSDASEEARTGDEEE